MWLFGLITDSTVVASSWGPVAWVVTGELFPLKVRAKCLSMTTATNWLLNFAIAYSTPYMVNEGPGYANLQSRVFFVSQPKGCTFLCLTFHQVWGSFCFVCIAFVWFMIYETKGLALEQVDELYGVVSKAWQSKSFRPQLSFRDVDEMDGAKRGMSMVEMAEESTRRKSVGSGAGAEKGAERTSSVA